MPQVLKEQKRQAIIDSTIMLINKYGLENVDMREIAKHSNITVGNLYRYYKDKQTLINNIIKPILNNIETILENNTKGDISLYKSNMNYNIDIKKIITNIIKDIYLFNKDNNIVINILLEDKYTYNMFLKWLKSLIINLNIKNKEQIILLEIHINSILHSVNVLLKYGKDLNDQQFDIINNYYINKLVIILKEITNGDIYE